jgi:O-antigen ligase
MRLLGGVTGTRLHRSRRPDAPLLIAGGVAGVLACAGVLMAFELPAKFVFAAFAAVVSVLLLTLSGNLRQVSLLLVFVCAPLGMRVSFNQFPHMGGAGAIFVDLVDPFIALLLFFQWRDSRLRPALGWRVPPAAVFWLGMIVLGVGSVLAGPLRTTALNETVRMAKLLLLALVILNEVVRRRQFEQVTVAIALMIIVQSGIAITQYAAGRQLGLSFLGEAPFEDIETLSAATLLSGDFVYRPDGLLGHANLLAGYLAMNMPIAVALLLAPVSRRLKLLLALALLLGQLALVLTLSRTGWIAYSLAFVLALVLGAAHPASRSLYSHARGALLGLTLALALVMSPIIAQRISSSDPTAVEYRLEWIQTAFAMIRDNPVFGVGLNAYTYNQMYYGKDRSPEALTDRYGPLWPAVHNSWLLTWTEQGTLGFLLWVAVHVSVLRVGIRNLRIRDPMVHALGVGLLAGYIAIMVDGMASFFVRTEAPGRLYWMAAALILAAGYWRQQQDQEAAASPEEPAPPPPASGAFLEPAAGARRWLPSRRKPLR